MEVEIRRTGATELLDLPSIDTQGSESSDEQSAQRMFRWGFLGRGLNRW